MEVSALIDSKLFAELRFLELKTRKSVSADIVGNFRSAFRGNGIVFDDLREYCPGDDVKSIHWKATARSNKVFVKSYLEERSVNVLVCVDISASTSFTPWSSNVLGSEKPSRTSGSSVTSEAKSLHRKAYELAAAIGIIAQSCQDAVGLILFGAEVEYFQPPRMGKRNIEKLLLTLLSRQELSSKTNFTAVFRHLNKYQKRRSLIFIVSDFQAEIPHFELSKASNKHDIVLVNLCWQNGDKSHTLPASGLITFIDPETKEIKTIDFNSSKIRRHFEKLEELHIAQLTKVAKDSNSDLINVRDSVLAPLFELMKRRAATGGSRSSHIIL